MKPSLSQRAFEPIDGLWLALFRIGFGACMVWQAWYYFSTDLIHNYYIEPPHHFTYPGFDWVKPWPGNGPYAQFFVLGVAAICIMLGFYYRTACLVFCIGFTHHFLTDKSWYLNHYYLICLLNFLAVFLPANRQLSIDAWRYSEMRSQSVPRWTLWLLRFQLGVPYFYGGIAKINSDWIHGEPMRPWLLEQKDSHLLGKYFENAWCVNGFVWGGMLLDLLIIPCLLWKRTRILAMIAMTAFHVLNTSLFDIGIFPWLMLIATLIVFTPVDTIAKLRGKDSTEPKVVTTLTTRQRSGAWLLSIYVVWQLLMPLRHFLYEGDTAFTREGHHFSWRMKLNRRDLDLRFESFDPATGMSRPLRLNRIIRTFQDDKVRDADQILLLAQWLRDELPEDQRDVEIRCDARVGLNGRPLVPFFDPELNLLSKQRGLTPPDWIRLYPEPRTLSELKEDQE
ncbi:MAG: HTTM domain-containing protein [Planctomycetaceae bacterium]